jgi:arsenate reductase
MRQWSKTSNSIVKKMFVIYHNPRCSKSRQALALLRDNAIEPIIVEYLKEPITKPQLKELLKKLGLEPRELLRKSEKEFKDLQLSNKSLSDDIVIDFMIKHPKLIERPIIVRGDDAVIGRPADKIFNLMK